MIMAMIIELLPILYSCLVQVNSRGAALDFRRCMPISVSL